MISKMILKKLTILESKIEEINRNLLTIAKSVSELAREQKIIRRKQNEILNKLDILLLRLQ